MSDTPIPFRAIETQKFDVHAAAESPDKFAEDLCEQLNEALKRLLGPRVIRINWWNVCQEDVNPNCQFGYLRIIQGHGKGYKKGVGGALPPVTVLPPPPYPPNDPIPAADAPTGKMLISRDADGLMRVEHQST